MGLPMNVDPKKLGEERKFKSVLSGYVYVLALIFKLSFCVIARYMLSIFLFANSLPLLNAKCVAKLFH